MHPTIEKGVLGEGEQRGWGDESAGALAPDYSEPALELKQTSIARVPSPLDLLKLDALFHTPSLTTHPHPTPFHSTHTNHSPPPLLALSPHTSHHSDPRLTHPFTHPSAPRMRGSESENLQNERRGCCIHGCKRGDQLGAMVARRCDRVEGDVVDAGHGNARQQLHVGVFRNGF